MAPPTGITRQQFLKAAVAAMGGLALSSCIDLAPSGTGHGSSPAGASGPVTVYKLSTRKRHCCKACHGHAANKLFTSPDAADWNRAHPGCNCRIRPYVVDGASYQEYFAGGSATAYDRRA